MAMERPSDVWREIILAVSSYADLLALVDSHPSFAQLLGDDSLLRSWLNKAPPRVRYEFGDIGRAYTYGDWTFDYVLPHFENCTLRYKIESLLARGCNASVTKNGKFERCGRRGGFSSRDEATFPFDLLRSNGWKACSSCLRHMIVKTDDRDSLAYLSTFTKIFPSTQVMTTNGIDLPLRHFRHLDQCYPYYKMSDVDALIERESSGLFTSFSAWKAGVIAKRGSTSELQISSLQHSARGLALPGGPGRTQIALEIARQSIKEYEHRMNQFVLAQHPDLPRLGLCAKLSSVAYD